MKKIGSLFIMVALLLVVNSCQKEINDEHFKLSESEARFLKFSPVKSGNDEKKKEFVQKIINDMDTQNKEKKFIENFVKKYGYPDWEMVRWFESSDETVAQVPVYFDEGCETEAVILCVEHESKLHFRLFIRDDFEKFSKNKKPVPTAEKIKDLFIIFDFQKFGQSSYLPNGTVKNASEISAKLKSATYYQVIQTCYVIMVTSGSELLSLRQECEYDYEWVSVSGSSGGTVYVDWYDEINGGTGTTSTPYECDCNICTVCGGCLNEPQLKSIPIPGEGGSETDIACPMCSCTPEVIKDVSFKNTKAECVYDKLVISNMMKNLLAEFVGSSKYNVTYTVVSSLDGYSGGQAYGSIKDNNDGSMTIKINSYYFDKVAPVTIAKTILHETIHAYIFQEVAAIGGYENLSTSDFENLAAYYNLYGETDYQHDYISQYYIPKMASTLRQFDGNKYSLSYYEALSWSGLFYTYGWQNMTQAQRDEIELKRNIINSGDKNCY